MSEMDKMQADAVNRARDMYRRSQNYNVNTLPSGYNGSMKETSQKNVSSQNSSQQPQQKTQRQPMKTTPQEIAEEVVKEELEEKILENITHDEQGKAPSVQQGGFQGGDFLDLLLNDKERTLIILLIALLNEEGANTSLLLALMYLIM